MVTIYKKQGGWTYTGAGRVFNTIEEAEISSGVIVKAPSCKVCEMEPCECCSECKAYPCECIEEEDGDIEEGFSYDGDSPDWGIFEDSYPRVP